MEGPLLGVPISGVCIIVTYVALKNDEDVISPYDFNLLFCRWLMRIILIKLLIVNSVVSQSQILLKIMKKMC